MKIKNIVFFIACLSMILASLELDARGRGGGGGGGRGRGGGGGRSINRSPSMSRSTPNRSMQNRNYNANRPRPTNRPTTANRPAQRNYNRSPATRDQLNRFLQNSNTQNLSRQNFSRPNATDFSRPNMTNVSRPNATNIARPTANNFSRFSRNDFQNALNRYNPGYRNWFDGNFFNNHGYNPPYNGNLWRAATWTAAASWMGYQWGAPIYYGGFEDDSYAPTTTQPDTSANTQTYTQTQPVTPPVNDTSTISGDWLPLGVFALGNAENAQTNPSIFMQLALNKNGEIAGTYYNSKTDVAKQLDGQVDQKSQLVAIKLSDDDSSPILQTGVYNLTQEYSPAIVTFPNGSKQNWTMTRVNQ